MRFSAHYKVRITSFTLIGTPTAATESVTAIEGVGVQLERRRKRSPLAGEALFIPLDRLENVLITESITGWTVHFNLVFLARVAADDLALHVAFEVPSRPSLVLELCPDSRTAITTSNGRHSRSMGRHSLCPL